MAKDTATEREIRSAVRSGRKLKLTTTGVASGILDAQMIEDVVRELGAEARGVKAHGVTISGQLNLDQVALPAGIELVNCRLPKGLSIAGSDLNRLSIERSQLGGLEAGAISVRGLVRLHDVSTSGQDEERNPVDLRNAHLGGVEVRTSTLHHFDLSSSIISGQVFIVDSTMGGLTNLVNANISGHLWFRSSNFRSDSYAWSIYARGLRVGGSLRFLAGCHTDAAASFQEVSIDGALDIYGGQYGGSGLRAFSLEDSRIGGSITIGTAWETDGSETSRQHRQRLSEVVSTYTAEIASLPANGHAKILDSSTTFYDGPLFKGSLQVERTTVVGDVRVSRCTTGASSDDISLACRAIVVGGELDISGSHCHGGGIDIGSTKVGNGMTLDLAHVGGVVNLAGSEVVGSVKIACGDVCGPVVLDQMQATLLDVDPTKLVRVHASLDGMVVQGLRFHGEPIADVKHWERALDVMNHGDAGYEAVAYALDSGGHGDLATRLRIARHRRARPQSAGARISHWLYGAFLGYGFRPSRMILVILGLIAAVAALTSLPVSDVALVTTNNDDVRTKGSSCESEFRCFDAALFAVDTVVPLVDLGQGHHWYADRTAPWGREIGYTLGVARVSGWAATTVFVIALGRAARDR